MLHTTAAAGINLLGTPVARGGSHRLRGREQQSLSVCALNGQPTDILLVARLLRTNEVGPLLSYGAVIDARKGSVLAVGIAV